MPGPSPIDARHVIGGDLKKVKFDRQLRLWGSDGQAALEAAHVVALGVTPAISEALKSLVLTGIRAVTLVDERHVSSEDVAANYFVSSSDEDDAACPLAAAVLQHVCALSDQCIAIAAAEAPEAWVRKYTAAVEHDWAAAPGADASAASAVHQLMRQYAPLRLPAQPANAATSVRPSPGLILVSERYTDVASSSPLVRACRTRVYPDVPVVQVRSSGLLGLVVTYGADRVITRPHNPTQVKMEDLHIFEPFPALQAWFAAHDPDDLAQYPTDDVDAMSLHSHIPYPCILHYAFRRWWGAMPAAAQAERRRRHANGSLFPLSAAEYREIAAVAGGMIRRAHPPEEAFVEALEKCTAKLNMPVAQRLPDGLAALLGDARCADPMLEVVAVQSRMGKAAGRERAVWASTEVLVWFVLKAVHEFTTRKIGVEASLGPNTCSASPTAAVAGDSMNLCAVAMPFCGHVPDFTTTTMWYRELQDLYHAKHDTDVRCIADRAWALLMAAAATVGDDGAGRDDGEVEEGEAGEQRACGAAAVAAMQDVLEPLLRACAATVVENIWHVCGVTLSAPLCAPTVAEWGERLGHQLVSVTQRVGEFGGEHSATARRTACLAIAYLSMGELQRRMESAAADVPARKVRGCDVEAEADALMADAAQGALAASGTSSTSASASGAEASPAPWWMEDATRLLFAQACTEVARWAGDGGSVQLPSVAASTGALAAQEAVKLLMRIRVPCGRPMFYDGYANCIIPL